jgi:putative oxidoreductase
MLAAASVLAPQGFFATGGGYEYPALLGLPAGALSLTGPGDWSLDRVLGHRLSRPWMSLVGLLTSSALSAVGIARRRKAVAKTTAGAAADAGPGSPRTRRHPLRPR